MRRIALLLLAGVSAVSRGAAQEPPGTLSGSALIDHWIRAKWEEAGLAPVARADDMEFMRRASLDIVGVIPPLAEAERFLAEGGADKRQTFVDGLLKDPRYATHWADVWSGILIGLHTDPRELFLFFKARSELKAMFEKNLPYDQFARAIITAKGAVYPQPAAAMEAGVSTPAEEGLAVYVYKIFQDAQRDLPKALAGKLTRTFMGVQIQCAQCHDHPFDKWTQEDFYGMASFFTEVLPRRTVIPEKTPPAPGEMKMPRFYFVIEDQAARPFRRGMMGMGPGMGLGTGMDLAIPESKGKPVKASFIESAKGPEPGVPRRAEFARLMTDPGNLQFARECVNRYWAHFFGAGIVNPPDDFSGKNKPSHPELLDALARDLIAHGYDLHWLIRSIAGSEAYGLTSRARDRSGPPEKLFALARVRALTPEQILGSVFVATGGAQGPPGAPSMGEEQRRRAMFGLLSQFRHAFGDDEGGELVDFSGSIPSALLMMNSPVVTRGTIARTGGGLGRLLASRPGLEERIRAIFLLALTRLPTEGEVARWSGVLRASTGDAGYEDLFWTLLNTSEFLFNH